MSNFPKITTRGDTVEFKDYYDEFQPIAGWVCDYIFINSTHKVVLRNNVDVVANITNNQYEINLDSNKTMLFNAAVYQINVKFTNTITNKVKTVTLDKVTFKENLENVNRLDVETWAEKGLRIILSYLANPSDPKIQSYELEGRKIVNFNGDEIQKKKYFYENEVKKERAKKSGSFKNNNLVYIKPYSRY